MKRKWMWLFYIYIYIYSKNICNFIWSFFIFSAAKRSTSKIFNRMVAFTEGIMRFWKSYSVTQGILCTRSPVSALTLLNDTSSKQCSPRGLLTESIFLTLPSLILKCFILNSDSFCERRQCSHLSAFKTKEWEWEEAQKCHVTIYIFKSSNTFKVILSQWVRYLLLTLFGLFSA